MMKPEQIKKKRPQWLDRLRMAPYQIKITGCHFYNSEPPPGIILGAAFEPKLFCRWR